MWLYIRLVSYSGPSNISSNGKGIRWRVSHQLPYLPPPMPTLSIHHQNTVLISLKCMYINISTSELYFIKIGTSFFFKPYVPRPCENVHDHFLVGINIWIIFLFFLIISIWSFFFSLFGHFLGDLVKQGNRRERGWIQTIIGKKQWRNCRGGGRRTPISTLRQSNA